jgi:putative transcriptional regulator
VKPIDASLVPGFIAAMPQLDDPNFKRAVVLLLRLNEEGALGLVINRPSVMSVYELCESQGIPCHVEHREPVMVGGPCEVESHLLVLHGDQPLHAEPHPEEVIVAPGIRLITGRDGLGELAERPGARLRCYLGYAGWGPGQLEDELTEGTWVPLAANDALIFEEPAQDVWAAALRMGGIDPVTLIQPSGDVN